MSRCSPSARHRHFDVTHDIAGRQRAWQRGTLCVAGLDVAPSAQTSTECTWRPVQSPMPVRSLPGRPVLVIGDDDPPRMGDDGVQPCPPEARRSGGSRSVTSRIDRTGRTSAIRPGWAPARQYRVLAGRTTGRSCIHRLARVTHAQRPPCSPHQETAQSTRAPAAPPAGATSCARRHSPERSEIGIRQANCAWVFSITPVSYSCRTWRVCARRTSDRPRLP